MGGADGFLLPEINMLGQTDPAGSDVAVDKRAFIFEDNTGDFKQEFIPMLTKGGVQRDARKNE